VQQVMQPVHARRKPAVFTYHVVSAQSRLTGRQLCRSSHSHVGPALRKLPRLLLRETFPMRAQQLAVNNEKTVWYRIVRMVDLWEMESQGEMWCFLLDGDVRCVPYIA